MDIELTDQQLCELFGRVNSFACVGLSANPVRPSYFVGRYLWQRGYKVNPVNPAYQGQAGFGCEFLPSLSSVPPERYPDVIDIFRRPAEVPRIVDEALELFPNLKVIWMQIGVRHEEAARRARRKGLIVIQNRCPKIEHQRLFGELRMGGFNTGILTSRLPSPDGVTP